MASANNASQFNIMTNPYLDNFTSVSGSDIVGVFGHVEFINLQGVSVSVNREIHPIYVMGRTDPISFVRGKRGVAGSIVTVCSDRGCLYDIQERYGVYAKKIGDTHIPGRNQLDARESLEVNVLSEFDRLGFQLATPQYVDQLPPFDITLVGLSDTLAATISRIGGVFIVSLGTGMSVDDNSIEQQMTFVALYYEDWKPAGRRNYNDLQRAADGSSFNPFTPENQGVDLFDSSAVDSADALGQFFGLTPDAVAANQ